MENYNCGKRNTMVSDRRPLSFSKTDNTRYENFKSGTGIPSKMDVTDEYLVVFRLFSYVILGVLRLQSRHTHTIVGVTHKPKDRGLERQCQS